MTEIYRGTNQQDKESRGWIVGAFMKEGLSISNIVEVKFESIKKGRVRENKDTTDQLHTMAILAKGKILFDFKGSQEPYLLDKPGDHVIWSPNCYHFTYAYKNTALISVRWKESK